MSEPEDPTDIPEEARLRQELAEIIVPGDAKCAICQATRRRHRQLEEAGELHHHFSEGGELRHSAPAPKQKRVPSTPDLVLRMALLNRGLITAEDLIRAELMLRDAPASGAGQSAAVPGGSGRPDRGDREDREDAGPG